MALSRYFLKASLFVLVASTACRAQEDKLRVMFYNVENLFDTRDDLHVNDNEFLPKGNKHWTSGRLKKKVNSLSKVVIAAGQGTMPDILGICEVENDTVLRQWMNSPLMRKHNYQVLHFDSPDQRGIDVACVYRTERLKVLDTVPILVDLPGRSRTRDILYCKFLVASKDTLHLFVNHWPSRRGGKAKSEPKRAMAASVLRHWTDSLQVLDSEAHILVMGDLNDHPYDPSVNKVLGAKNPEDSTADSLVNLMYPYVHSQGGTHKYRGKWGVLDHMIVSKALLDETGLNVKTHQATIFKADFMLEEDDHGQKPKRTYAGPRYLGGYSDHLPILLDIHIR